MNKQDKQKPVQVTSLKTLDGGDPEFCLPVTIKTRNGKEATIDFTVKALRQTEWAAIRDEALGKTTPQEQGANEADQVADFSFVNVIQGGMSKAANLVLKFAIGWDLEDQFTHQSLVELDDRHGGSLRLLLEAYDAAIFNGRLGN